MRNKYGSLGCGMISLILGIALLLDMGVAWIFQGLWNFIMPSVFNLPLLTYWQAFVILLLISLIGSCFRTIKTKD